MLREDIQFHWENRGYASFDAFLAALSSRKRKDIRKERAAAQAGVEIRHLTGDAIRPEHWDAFWRFYQDTGARKWGRPYLTREAFTLLGERMGDRIEIVRRQRGAGARPAPNPGRALTSGGDDEHVRSHALDLLLDLLLGSLPQPHHRDH